MANAGRAQQAADRVAKILAKVVEGHERLDGFAEIKV